MERKKNEAVRGKHLKPESRPATKAAMRRAGRYKAIEAARNQVREAQQSAEQEQYSATDKVESYTAGAVHEIIHYPRPENNPFHGETDFSEATTPAAPRSQDRISWERVDEYPRAKVACKNKENPQKTGIREAPAPKASTPQKRMRRETVKEYRQARAEQSKNAFHHETDYIEAPAPKQPTPQERMRREAVKEYRHARVEQGQNAFHHETDYFEAPALRTPRSEERMRREAVKEYRQAKAEQSKNAFHRETHYAEVPVPRAEKPQKQMLQTFLEGDKETAPLLQANEAPALSPIKNEAESVKPRIQPKMREVRESVKSPITATGQRQTALPRNTSSIKAAKKQLIKEQGRKAAREKAVKELTTGTVSTGSKVIKDLSVAVSRALTPSRETLIYAAGILILILIPVVVIMGVASMLSSTGKGRDNFVPVSEDVEGYRPLIRQYAAEFGIPEYEDLIAAVMMQESGGQTSDPMQCSESGYNTEYPREPGGITDPEYSIKVGVQTLAEVLDMAGVESPLDLDRISLALQGYNYGSGYISWALSNYGGYSELNAIEFSDMMAAQYGWAGYGDKAYVSHVLRYYPVGRAFMGEGNAAMVAVAQSQIGNVGGAPYWSWWGLNYRVEWCAIFVSWCADQCGYLDAGVLPKMEGVRPYVDWFIERGQWQDRDYEPSPGDIIFFDWEGDGMADHVGIVEKVENGLIYTVEGNSEDVCAERRYTLGSASVYGFGLPLY